MNVQPVSMIKSVPYSSKLQSSRKTDLTQKPDSITFTSYSSVLESMTKAKLDRESHVEKYFGNLMSALWTDGKMTTNETFSKITDIYIQKGLRGMLMEFWNAHPSQAVKNITDEFGENLTITLGNLKADGYLKVLQDNLQYT